MYSICIPVYNYDVNQLVYSLHEQAEELAIPYEIILMDDASSPEFQEKNSKINLPHLRYIQLELNIGRAKIRNRLAETANFRYLIFMDCDSAVSSENYIKNYANCFEENIVCYGGCAYSKQKPQDKKYLRWKYGINRESDNAEERKKDSNFGFKTGNFLIDKHIFEKITFDESFNSYGHEDTLFGIQLSSRGIEIKHIDNPLIHLGLEDAEVFLNKTESAVINLYKIDKILKDYPQYAAQSNLAKTAKRIKNLHLTSIFAKLFLLSKSPLKRILLSKTPFLFLLDIYKLGIFCAEENKK